MRVAIVNDMLTITEMLRRIITSRPDFEVAWVAADGPTAIRKAIENPADVILMDLQMPGMSGAEATGEIMRRAPCQILVVTSSVAANYSLVCEAMGHGAYDAINTPTVDPSKPLSEAGTLIFEKLAKVGRISRSGFIKQAEIEAAIQRPQSLPGSDSGYFRAPVIAPASASVVTAPSDSGVFRRPSSLSVPIIAIGASTGGPPALQAVLSSFPVTLPAAVVVIQHIDREFADGLVSWLSEKCPLRVARVNEGDCPQVGTVHVAATNDHLILKSDGRFGYTPEPVANPYRPSVDAMFESLAKHGPRVGVAALLTGIGRDGANGLLKLKQRGWQTVAQDEATSVVYGMPAAAAAVGAAQRVLPIKDIGPQLVTAISQP